ncbi:MAG TPA: TIGR02206 family membrane protein [Bacillota bacterium]|nr:TIGR02206 family membrane protein [Bacillota bacterium]
MQQWLSDASGAPFVWLGTSHIIVLTIYILGVGVLFSQHKRITANESLLQTLRWGLFGILVFSEIIYHIWAMANGVWNAAEFLPLHLCGIAGICCAIALVTSNQTIVEIVYFIGFFPAFLAVATPELIYDFPHFRFWKFFIHHCAISWGSFFVVITSPITITWKSMLNVYIMLLAYAAVVGFFINPLLDANYLFLDQATSAQTPLNLLGDGFWYYVNLGLLALVVFIGLWRWHKIIKGKTTMQ